MPLLKPFLVIITLLTLESSLKIFDLMLTMTNGGPFYATEVVAGRLVRRLPWWIAALVVGIGCLLWIYPFLWMVSASVKNPLEAFSSGLGLLPDT